MAEQAIDAIDPVEKLNAAIARATATFERGEAVLRRDAAEQRNYLEDAGYIFLTVVTLLIVCWVAYDVTHALLLIRRAS